MEALCAAGVPLIAECGVHGGWVLAEAYQTRLTGLSPAEIQAIFLGIPSKQLDQLGLGKSLEGARAKLMAALPILHQHDAAFVRERIYVDGTPWARSNRPEEDVSYLSLLHEAVWQMRQVRMTYEASDDLPTERVIHPLGLVAKSGAWYVVALRDGEMRTYRISRIKAAEMLDAPTQRPAHFDLAAYWQQSVKAMITDVPRVAFELRAKAEIVQDLYGARHWVRVVQVKPADETGWCRVALTYEHFDQACRYVLGYAADVEVIAPQELRRAVAALARATAQVNQ